MKFLEEMKLEELKNLNQEEYIYQYYEILKQLNKNRLDKQIIETLKGESINKIIQKLEQEEEQLRSYSFFPGNLIILYPNIKELHSKSYQTCDFSGGIIHPGSLYINYRPLLENLNTKEVYVLKKSLKVEVGYIDRLPNTIFELETLEQNMILETPDDEIDFNHLNHQLGGKIILQKLRKNKENRK